jgi:lipid-A-disaccharide synthase
MTKTDHKKIFIVAGESSGDARAAEVVAALRAHAPSWEFTGIGGAHMRSAGVTTVQDLTSVAVIGITDVLRKYSFFRNIFYQTLETIKQTKPDAVILVDYPGFNLRLAKRIKALNIPVLYYVSPQVWAWASWRVNTIARIVDKMFVILPFEVDVYKKTTLDVEFVGHPLVGKCKPSEPLDVIKKKLELGTAHPIITLLPGSRKNEIKKLLPVMMQAAEIIRTVYPHAAFVISKTPHLDEGLYQHILKGTQVSYRLTSLPLYDIASIADFCWVTSGTATLETALLHKPFIILYKTSFLTYILAKYLITIPYIGLVNIVAGKKVVPEFLQKDAHPDTIAHETMFILKNKTARDMIIQQLEEVENKLGSPGAPERVAQSIITFLSVR